MTNTQVIARRESAINVAFADIREILRTANNETVGRPVLAKVAARIELLASNKDLFLLQDFPPPQGVVGGGGSKLYRIFPTTGDADFAMYLNAGNPGDSSLPHNHTTWVAIASVQGQELNRIFRRTDDGSTPGIARLELEREVCVEPGNSMTLLPDEIHSIFVTGNLPALKFHVYGRALETLDERIGVQLDTGEVFNYNARIRAQRTSRQ